jgi:Domain of unknown function (DUF3883)
MADAWSDIEINLIVADYFAMLSDELLGQAYSKADHNRALQQHLPSPPRSRGSIEFKHQNISAILYAFGLPWIDGYKPAVNVQYALVDGVQRWLDAHPDWLLPATKKSRSRWLREQESVGNVDQLAPDYPSLWIGPPPAQRNAPPPVDPAFTAAIARKYDAAERDGRNRSLGKAGEELILHHERQTLSLAGRSDLADKVRWTAEQDGDGYGYDISSFEPDGRTRLIEVKTTNGWERTPFHISRNELAVAEARHDHWYLIRLWNFARQPSAFALRPPLSAHVELTPTSFLASLQ